MSLSTLSLRRDRPVLADRLPGTRLRDLGLVVLAAALTGLCAQFSVPLPGTPVPLTGQTFAVLLSGATLGPRRGAAAMLLYTAAGVAGVPWLAGGAHGWPAASGGYLIGFVAAATLTGWGARLGLDRTAVGTAVAMLAATLLIYACGAAGLVLGLHIDLHAAISLGVLPFWRGDLLKLLLATLVLPLTWRLVGRP